MNSYNFDVSWFEWVKYLIWLVENSRMLTQRSFLQRFFYHEDLELHHIMFKLWKCVWTNGNKKIQCNQFYYSNFFILNLIPLFFKWYVSNILVRKYFLKLLLILLNTKIPKNYCYVSQSYQCSNNIPFLDKMCFSHRITRAAHQIWNTSPLIRKSLQLSIFGSELSKVIILPYIKNF